jgi:CRISPR-associated protein Csy3
MAKKNDIATVLAFEKKLVPSDGLMYGTTWENRNNNEALIPLRLREKSVRGTISNRLKAAIKNDPLKLNAEVEKPNLQTVDSCALNEDQDTLTLRFTLKVLSDIQQPSACNHREFNEKYTKVAEEYIETEGFRELAKRYVINLANARFLWRNRVGVENLEVNIKLAGSNKAWTFDAKAISIRDFDYDDPNIQELAKEIAATLSGKKDFILLDVTAFAQVGKAQDVYPSEELVLDKSSNTKGGKSKVLYSVNETAAMHSQKIGNAIRCVDTWYPEYTPDEIGPIALEPYGAVTNLGIAYRNPKDKSDFFTLFDQWVLEGTLEPVESRHYVMGVLVRGGVFGESGKE